MCGPLLWGSAWTFWWIFPLIGIAMCLLMAFRFARTGSGCMGMGGHSTAERDNIPGPRH